MGTKSRATYEDLHRVPGKAEIVNGEIVLMSPTGDLPGAAGDEIFVSLTSTSTGLVRVAPSATTRHSK